MTFPVPRTISRMALAAALLSPLAAPPAMAQQGLSEEKIRAFAEAVQDGSLSASPAQATCTQQFESDPSAKDVREVMSTFLQVSETNAIGALCEALVRAIRADAITADELATTVRKTGEAELGIKVGRFLRTIYFAHTSVPAAAVEGRAAR